MSTFLSIVRYANGSADGEMQPLRRAEVEEALKLLPTFRAVDTKGPWGVKLPGTGLAAVLESSGTLSCQLAASSDSDLVVEMLQKLAAEIPGAVVEDEEGERY